MYDNSQFIKYVSLPDGMNFSTEFPTYILAFCIDTDSWFATNQRFFYYEYPMEFENEKAAIEYFEKNPSIFVNIEKEIGVNRPSFLENKVFLENVKKFYQ